MTLSRLMASSVLAAASVLYTVGAFAEDGIAPKSILIGQNITLKAGKSDYGVAVREGVDVAIREINDKGGVNGRQIVIKVMDDDGNSSQAAQNAATLIDQDKVFLVFGSVEGGPSTAMMKVTVEKGVPFFGPMAGSPELRADPTQPVYPVRAGHREEFIALMNQARSLGMSRMAFFRSDTATGEAHLDNVRRHINSAGLQLAADLPFKSDVTDEQLKATVEQIKSSGAQMVFNHGSASVYVRLIRLAKQMNCKAVFWGVNSGSTQIAEQLGDIAHGMIFAQVVPSPWERKTAITRAYQAAMKQYAPNGKYSYGSLEGYVTAQALAVALQKAGANPTRASFAAGLKDTQMDIEGLRLNYHQDKNPGLTLVDLAMVNRRGQFIH